MHARRRGPVLNAAPFALPTFLDGAAERWWRARPRSRALLGSFIVSVVALLLLSAARPAADEVRVLVAARDLVAGERVTAASVDEAWWPSALAPEGVLREPAGVVTAPLPRGAVVTDRHLGDGGIGARIPTGSRAVAVPTDQLPPVGAGARLDVLGVGHEGTGVPLANDAVVIAVDGDVVWLTVDPAAAPAVSSAAAAGRIAAVVHPA